MNGSVKWNVGVIVTILVLAATAIAAFAVLNDDMGEMEPKVAQNSEAITGLEKADIGIQGAVDALRVQQNTYHKESDRKLDTILTAVEKGNATR